MQSVLDTCQPRPEILAGSFNPEVFTASLGPIIKHYHGGQAAIDNIYTDAKLFFREATYPTQGLCLTLAEVFSRIAGNMTVPAIHRLETAFGGGKTHTLIACTHIAGRGAELSDVTADILDPALLPEPGSVAVVGVAGDEIPVHKPKGEALVPYTLWGEIAFQIGGEDLYRKIEDDASSYAAPGRTYFEIVFSERKALIMLDELAQYSARLEAARPDGAGQLAAFLMALHGYARNHPGIAVVLTLASATDAFGKQTEHLAKLIGDVRGAEVNEDDALGIGERAVKGVASVVARDAVQITPVQAAEISSVLAKRLFVSIDRNAAIETAGEYMQMYRRNASLLPEEASGDNFQSRMIANYPFHPMLVNYLNHKLAAAENFQGTRGVLRVLSLVVHSLWQNSQAVPLIHTCHLNLRSDRVVNELLGRTGSSDLLLVLNADVGSVDTGALEGGLSNAEISDRENPHPQAYPLYEYTWKTVFLHSLVGRAEGLSSRIFGISETEALFCVSFPGLTPHQVRTALEKISESAFYLRFEQGKYYAGTEPTINSVLARIRKTLKMDQVSKLLQDTAGKIISKNSKPFYVEQDVSLPEHLPDGKDRPVLGIVLPLAGTVDVEAMITTKGLNKPRMQQNLIFLLVPETVVVEAANEQEAFFHSQSLKAQDALWQIETIARQVKAMRVLQDKPQDYGINPRLLEAEDFQQRLAERGQALQTAVSKAYTGLYYSGAGGHIVRKEVTTAGGEGGLPFIEQICEMLMKDGELLTVRNTTQADLLNLSQLFFTHSDTISLETLRNNFYCMRSWPVPESSGVLEQLVRSGVQKGTWCVYSMGDVDNVQPAEFYHSDHEIPWAADLSRAGYSLITVQGAQQRGWGQKHKIEPAKVREGVIYEVAQTGSANFHELLAGLTEQHGPLPAQELEDAVATLVKTGNIIVLRNSSEQEEKPEIIHGAAAALYTPKTSDTLITPARAAELGLLSTSTSAFKLSGQEGAEKFLPLLRRLGSLYGKGAKSTLDSLDLVDLELPQGGTLRLQLNNATPASMKSLGELFEVLDSVAKKGEYTEVYLEIADPNEDCPLIHELKDK